MPDALCECCGQDANDPRCPTCGRPHSPSVGGELCEVCQDEGDVTGPCECEHEVHFGEDHSCAHPYGAEIAVEELGSVQTMFGRFVVCGACRSHLEPFLAEAKPS